MKPQRAATLIFILKFINFVACGTDYCEINPQHIACDHSYDYGEKCPPDASIVKLTQEEIDAVLKAHNEYRNQIAGGLIQDFSSATDMQFVSWNEELAKLALLNTMQCEMEHDKCRNTEEFDVVGQNLYRTGGTGGFISTVEALEKAVKSWTDESNYASQACIDYCCCKGRTSKPIGHFTQVVRNNASYIGCGVTKYTQREKGYKTHLVACNYSYGNMFTTAVYTAGPPGASCKNGRHSTYTNLCL